VKLRYDPPAAGSKNIHRREHGEHRGKYFKRRNAKQEYPLSVSLKTVVSAHAGIIGKYHYRVFAESIIFDI